jgi:hypothetical protein
MKNMVCSGNKARIHGWTGAAYQRDIVLIPFQLELGRETLNIRVRDVSWEYRDWRCNNGRRVAYHDPWRP